MNISCENRVVFFGRYPVSKEDDSTELFSGVSCRDNRWQNAHLCNKKTSNQRGYRVSSVEKDSEKEELDGLLKTGAVFPAGICCMQGEYLKIRADRE